MAISAAVRTAMKSMEVNWLPWSVLKTSGRPWRASASSSASMQKSADSVIDSRQARTLRLYQSMTAARQTASLVAPLVRATMASARHRHVGDVHRPDLVGSGHRKLAQQVREDLVPRRRLRRPRAAVEGLDRHLLHQRRDVEPAHLMAFGLQHSLEHPAAGEGVLEVQLVDPAHEREIGVRHRPWQIVDAASADPERLCLAANAEPVGAVNHRFALANRPALPSAPDKKSFSSVSSPIFAWSVFTSKAGVASAGATAPNTPEAPSRSCERHCVIWLG